MPRLPEGWKLASRSPRKYRAPSGEIVSRYEYERRTKRGDQGLGHWRSRSQYRYWEHKGGRNDYQFFLGEAAAYQGVSVQSLDNPRSEFSQLYAAALNSGWDTDPDGPYADFLVYVGKRDTEDWWDVGDTP